MAVSYTHLDVYKRQENNNVQLIMDVEDLKINIETAINVGLILNEILTNSIKYAFPDGAKGNIFINFHRTDNHYILTAVSYTHLDVYKRQP